VSFNLVLQYEIEHDLRALAIFFFREASDLADNARLLRVAAGPAIVRIGTFAAFG
jgi:hypothetical protein